MMKRRQFVFGTAFGIAGLTAGLRGNAQAQGGPTPQDVYFDPGNPVLGNPKGDVTVAEYYDFQCPYCKRDFPMVRDVVAKDGKVRLVMKDWPIFGPPSVYAAQLSLAAGKLGQQPKFVDTLMAVNGRLTDAGIDSALSGAGFDVARLRDTFSRNEKELKAVLARNNAQAEAFGFPGTPAYVVGRQFYPGVLDANGLRQAIAEARKAS